MGAKNWGGHTTVQRRPAPRAGQNGHPEGPVHRARAPHRKSMRGAHHGATKAAPPSGPDIKGHTTVQRRPPPLRARHQGAHRGATKAGTPLRVASAGPRLPGYIYIYIYTRFYRLATLRRYNLGRMAPTVPAATAISVNGERGTGAARSGRLPGVAGATSFDGLPNALRRTMFVLFLRVTLHGVRTAYGAHRFDEEGKAPLQFMFHGDRAGALGLDLGSNWIRGLSWS